MAITLNRTIVTPKLRAEWPDFITPSIYTPPNGSPKEGDMGKYKAKLVIDPDNEEHAKFLQKLDDMAEEMEHKILESEGKKRIGKKEEFIPLSDQEDEDGNPTGLKLLRVAKRAGFTRRDGSQRETPLDILDSTKAPFDTKGREFASGTVCITAFTPRAYKGEGNKWGLALDMVAVMIFEPQWRGGGQVDAQEAFADVEPEDFDSGFEASDGDY